MSITKSWHAIEKVLREHSPNAYKALRGPASEAQIRALERKLGQRLPADLARSLRIHNGMKDSYLGVNRFFDYEALLSTRDIASQWSMMGKLLRDGCFESGGDPQTTTRKIKNDQWWRVGWVPITDADGSGFVLDLDPAAAGKKGQVFYFYHNGWLPRTVIAASHGDWLRIIAEKLTTGSFSIDEGTIEIDNGLWPHSLCERSRSKRRS